MNRLDMKILRNDVSKQAADHIEEFLKEARIVLLSGKYILGPQLQNFEHEFAAYCGTRHAVGVASGTEAIYLALKVLGIGHGDEVITSPFTFIGTVSAILMTGATPVFADIDPATFNIDPHRVASVISNRTKALMPVHLYGQLADMEALGTMARNAGIPIVEDAAQAHGSHHRGRKAGTFGYMACYSFYPSKNLGAYGDAGAVVTDNDGLAAKLQTQRNYGQRTLYECVTDGINSRLDELQAAFLNVKLRYLDAWNERRQVIAQLYTKHLPEGPVHGPTIRESYYSNFHVYTIRATRRNELAQFLAERGIQTNVYYPIPLHLQEGFMFLGYRRGDFPQAERACAEVLALPMYPEMPEEYVVEVCNAIRQFYGV